MVFRRRLQQDRRKAQAESRGYEMGRPCSAWKQSAEGEITRTCKDIPLIEELRVTHGSRDDTFPVFLECDAHALEQLWHISAGNPPVLEAGNHSC